MITGFTEFIRKQGVVGLAIGFLLGGAVSKVVTSLVQDVINPIVGIALGRAAGLTEATISFGPVLIHWGRFVSNCIDFAIIAAVVYWGFKALRLDRLDLPK